jgi:hypothetical protein
MSSGITDPRFKAGYQLGVFLSATSLVQFLGGTEYWTITLLMALMAFGISLHFRPAPTIHDEREETSKKAGSVRLFTIGSPLITFLLFSSQ